MGPVSLLLRLRSRTRRDPEHGEERAGAEGTPAFHPVLPLHRRGTGASQQPPGPVFLHH